MLHFPFLSGGLREISAPLRTFSHARHFPRAIGPATRPIGKRRGQFCPRRGFGTAVA
jgi:hypothetical protein